MGLRLKAEPTFKFALKIPLPGGAESDPVEFVFRHRTRAELQEFYAWLNQPENPPGDGEALEKMLAGWNLADDFNRENIDRLVDNYHGAAEAITNAYLEQLTQRRRGNFEPLRSRS